MNYFFMSFRDPKKNKNLGVCVVLASDFRTALKKAWDLNINPSGEVMSAKLSESEFLAEGLELDRLYTKAEMKELRYETNRSS